MLPMFTHQQDAHDAWIAKPRLLNFSDAGSGKTRATLEVIKSRNTESRVLVLAPLSILQPAWGDDIEKWTPELTYVCAYSKNRQAAFDSDAQIVITNHDAVKWIAKNPDVLAGFDTLVIDESTAYKNPTSQRSKTMKSLKDYFEYRVVLTGTPNPNSICDLWHQTLLVDDGDRLGQNFYHFRSQVQSPVPVAAGINKWVDKPNAEDVVTAMLADITFRVKLEDCIDMPEHTVHDMYINIPSKLRKQYNQLLYESVLELDSGTIDPINAGSKFRKLLQLITGQVYDSSGNSHLVHTERYELVADLVEQRKQCVIAFNYRHEREALEELFRKRKISYGVIDGTVSSAKRKEVVDGCQSGKLKAVIAHPQSAGHGLTLTAATSTIWASPTYNAEHYEQFNRRIYRAGQKQKTETIRISARDTVEESVYEKLETKRFKLHNVLSMLKELCDVQSAA